MYGAPHVITLICVIVISALLIMYAKKLNDKQKLAVTWSIFGVLLFFEIMHRIYRLLKGHQWFRHIPMHFCAIMVWVIIAAILIKNKHLYNIAAVGSLLASSTFLLHPAVGFTVQPFRFDQYYTIITHCITFLTGVYFIVGGYTDIRWKTFWSTAIFAVITLTYSALINFVFLPGSNYLYYVDNITPFSYTVFIVGYVAILLTYLFLFFAISDYCSKYKIKKQLTTLS